MMQWYVGMDSFIFTLAKFRSWFIAIFFIFCQNINIQYSSIVDLSIWWYLLFSADDSRQLWVLQVWGEIIEKYSSLFWKTDEKKGAVVITLWQGWSWGNIIWYLDWISIIDNFDVDLLFHWSFLIRSHVKMNVTSKTPPLRWLTDV